MLTTLEEYLKPNAHLRPPQPCPELWTPPAPSRKLRPISSRSKGSTRGHIVVDNTRVDIESRLEKFTALVFRARSGTADVVEQTPRVTYVDDSGKLREHFCDLKVTRTDGFRTAILVKPAAKVVSSGIDRVRDLIAEQMSPDVADGVLLFTEKKMTRTDRFNGEWIHACCKHPNPGDDAIVADLIGWMAGATRIEDLVRQSGLNGFGFRAVTRAIADGRIRLVESCMITRGTFVVRNTKAD
jgi:hypothetical protein